MMLLFLPVVHENSMTSASIMGRLLSTHSNKVDEPFKVEEAETVNVPPPLSEKV